MAVFDSDTCHEILRVLGYTVPYTRTYFDNLADQDFPETVIDRVATALTQIANIDKQIQSSLPDTMAIEVGELKLNYRQHYAMLKSQARSLVLEIGSLTGLAVIAKALDKYGSGGAIASYW